MARIASPLDSKTPGDGTRTLIIFAAVIAALYFGSEILVPIALAILLSFVMAPAVRLLGKIGLGRTLPVAITVLVTFLMLAGLGLLIATQIRDLSNDLPRYEATMLRKIQYVKDLSSGGGLQRIEQAVNKLTVAINRNTKPETGTGTSLSPGEATAPGPGAATNEAAPKSPQPVQVVPPVMGPLETMMMVAAPLLHPLATAFIVLIFVVFILLQREDLRNRAIRLFGASDLQRTTAAINDGAKRLSRYLLTQCAVNAGAGLVVALGLWLIGLPSPVLLGVLFACLRFVPYVGPIIGALLPVAMAAVVDPGWSMVISTLLALGVVELVISQAIEPLAYGHNTGLSPIAIIIAATFWTVLWGPVGLLLSTPLTVCLVVLGRHVEHLEFLDVLLGDRPPLTPPEIFYQRMLANDPVEAADHAQRCLADMSIPQYYDEVALPGLLLAQEDAAQNRLDAERQLQIGAAAREVVEDLDHDLAEGEAADARYFWQRAKPEQDGDRRVDDLVPEVVPEALTREGSVLCVGARGPLDDAAAAMLAQVLKHHAIGARAESYVRLSKAEIASLDVASVALICVSVLDGSSVAFLRFVLRRLHRQAPGAKILVGAWWRRDGLRETDPEIDAAVKDPKVVTFVDAVRFCLAMTAEPVAPTEARPEILSAAS